MTSGAVALVVGGAIGIGRASALAFAAAGYRVAVADIDSEAGEELVDSMNAAGQEAIFIQGDASREDDVRRFVGRTVEYFGRLTCAHNNVGVVRPPFVRLHELSVAQWDEVIETNLRAIWLSMKYELAQMIGEGAGSIVNTASVAGLVGSNARSGAYSASKHGVVGLTKTAALEYARDGIRINAVCPGITDTRMLMQYRSSNSGLPDLPEDPYATARLGRPDEIAEAVVWLASDAASFVTGVALPVDGGFVAG